MKQRSTHQSPRTQAHQEKSTEPTHVPCTAPMRCVRAGLVQLRPRCAGSASSLHAERGIMSRRMRRSAQLFLRTPLPAAAACHSLQGEPANPPHVSGPSGGCAQQTTTNASALPCHRKTSRCKAHRKQAPCDSQKRKSAAQTAARVPLSLPQLSCVPRGHAGPRYLKLTVDNSARQVGSSRPHQPLDALSPLMNGWRRASLGDRRLRAMR